MPKYKTRKIRAAIKRRNTSVKAVPRDKRLLMRWARKGTAKDYQNLREFAGNHLKDAPNWVTRTRSRSSARRGTGDSRS